MQPIIIWNKTAVYRKWSIIWSLFIRKHEQKFWHAFFEAWCRLKFNYLSHNDLFSVTYFMPWMPVFSQYSLKYFRILFTLGFFITFGLELDIIDMLPWGSSPFPLIFKFLLTLKVLPKFNHVKLLHVPTIVPKGIPAMLWISLTQSLVAIYEKLSLYSPGYFTAILKWVIIIIYSWTVSVDGCNLYQNRFILHEIW